MSEPTGEQSKKDPNANVTNMTAQPKRTKLVKVKAKQLIKYEDDNGKPAELNVGQTAMVTPALAKKLCAVSKGYYNFSGERFGEDGQQRQRISRAEIVPEEESETSA